MSPKPVKSPPPEKPGRPEFITFDTPDGMSIVFFEHVTGVECVRSDGAPDESDGFGVRFILAPASGQRYNDKMGLTKQQARHFVSFLVTRYLMQGPIVRGKFLDVDHFLGMLVSAARKYAESQGGLIVGPDGNPASAEGPRLVTPDEAAQAEGGDVA